MTYEDGFGRTIKTLDPAGAETDTACDSMGRLASVSNWHWGTPASTDGTTTFSYDGLGRMTKQVDADGTSTQHWSYTGPTVTFTGENGNRWQRTTDALGRLTSVIEDAGNSKLETDYQYDVLNDLTRVDQWGGSEQQFERSRAHLHL